VLSLTLHADFTRAQCVDYSVFPTVTAVQHEWTGNGRVQMFRDDHLLSLAAQYLRVFSLDDPSSPQPLAQVDCGVPLSDLAICGPNVYCRDESGAVHVISLMDPAHPLLLGTADLGGYVTSLGGNGDLLAVTAADSSWSLYKLDNLITPRLLFQDQCDFTVRGICVTDGWAVPYGSGWKAYDLADPAGPNPINYPSPNPINYQWFYSVMSNVFSTGKHLTPRRESV
jgi:hypothetical protein